MTLSLIGELEEVDSGIAGARQSWALGVPPMPAAAVLKSTAQCIFKNSGKNLAAFYPQDLLSQWGLKEVFPIGIDLCDFLRRIQSQWADLLPSTVFTEATTCFLPWYSNEEPLSMGLTLRSFPYDHTLYVTLEPNLAPQIIFQDSTRDATFLNDSLVSQLLLRLKTAEARLSHYHSHFPGVFFSQKSDFSFNYLSPQVTNLLGSACPQLFTDKKLFLELLHEEDREKFLNEALKATHSVGLAQIFYRIRHPDTQEIIYLLDARIPQYAPNGVLMGYEGIWLNQTRQVIAEARLMRSTWKESLATLTAGLVHDFSNVMAGIFSLSELYCSQLPKENPMYEGLAQIKKSSSEAQKLVRRLIDLNREESKRKGYYNLETLITDQIDLLKAILPKNTEIITHLSGRELPIYVDDVAFRQMLLNLAVNARDALHQQRGEIIMSVRHVRAGESLMQNTIGGPIVAAREGAEIQFKDNGIGIKREHLDKIFTPFFTTKELSKGSGFGLYNIRLFVEENKGIIRFCSTPQQGTTFFIYLPLADIQECQSHLEFPEKNNERRPSFVVYAAEDPKSFEIVNLFHEKEWEVITFSDAERVKQCIKDMQVFAPTLFFIDLGHDPSIPSLVNYFKAYFPQLKLLLQVHGRNPHQLPLQVRESVDALWSDNVSPHAFIQQIECLI